MSYAGRLSGRPGCGFGGGRVHRLDGPTSEKAPADLAAASRSPAANARARVIPSRGRLSCGASASKIGSTLSAQLAAHAAMMRRSCSLRDCGEASPAPSHTHRPREGPFCGRHRRRSHPDSLSPRARPTLRQCAAPIADAVSSPAQRPSLMFRQPAVRGRESSGAARTRTRGAGRALAWAAPAAVPMRKGRGYAPGSRAWASSGSTSFHQT